MPDPLAIPKSLRRKVGKEKSYIPTFQEIVEMDQLDRYPPGNQELAGEPIRLPEGMKYQEVYYMRGTPPRSFEGRYYVKDPPTSGKSKAFVLGDEGAKKLTMFCPFTLDSFQMPPEAYELHRQPQVAMTDLRLAHLVQIITDNWHRFVGMGFQRDYDVAALVLTRLGAEVPKVSLADAPPPREGEIVVEKKARKGGKPPADDLIKPVGRTTKRGMVAEFFLGSEQKSIRECMARLSMTRNSVLSALHILNKDHGIGYETINDTANLIIPIDWDIWAE